jgi:hypothetical protein
MTIDIGQLHRESSGENDFSTDRFVGQAAWQILEPASFPSIPAGVFPEYPNGLCVERPELQVLQVSVPPDLLWAACAPSSAKLLASFLHWRDSGIVIITFTIAGEGLVVALDLAGRTDLQALQTASQEDRIAATLCFADEPEVSPMRKVVGVHEALAEASMHRRLVERELMAAIEDLRCILRTDGVFGLLGLPPREDLLKSVTLNVCLPP